MTSTSWSAATCWSIVDVLFYCIPTAIAQDRNVAMVICMSDLLENYSRKSVISSSQLNASIQKNLIRSRPARRTREHARSLRRRMGCMRRTRTSRRKSGNGSWTRLAFNLLLVAYYYSTTESSYDFHFWLKRFFLDILSWHFNIFLFLEEMENEEYHQDLEDVVTVTPWQDLRRVAETAEIAES